ncbi:MULTISPECIES: hypothetical protein [Psychrobacter]|uniref:ATP-binding protein n=1 Tax=Psychrobacter halodurans TaxID=2818439 RepID=A0AAW4IUX4_9GAMM|nr:MULTISPECIES: hypothetical protein [Psychrobacter]MBO1516568.1 hypothetical protein [Psychrobacter halodurans]PJX26809.1 hypothetical protein CAP50_03325 [Psychrobacter sp. L7]
MKKTTLEQKNWIKKLNIKVRKSHSKKDRTIRLISHSKKRIEFNKKLSLFHGNERTKIIKVLRSLSKNTYNQLYLDFRKLELIEPLTALHIVHVLNKYEDLDIRFKSRHSQSIVPRAVFTLLGLDRVLGLSKITKNKHIEIVDNWHMFSGNNCDLPEDMQSHILMIYQKFTDQNIPFKLVTAINEAINNVIQHAYMKSSDPDFQKWYALTRIDEKCIVVVVSDLGVTIPETAPLSILEVLQGKANKVKEGILGADLASLKDHSDSKLIQLATNLDTTRTKEKGRGKGFNDILDLVRRTNEFPEIKQVHTSVLSKSGSYLLQSNSDGSAKELSLNKNFDDFESKIEGTVISWVIRLV